MIGSQKCRSELIFAKSRVGPMKRLTIPRMELMGAMIGVRCLKFVQDELRLPTSKRFVWSDSTCVLNWIHSSKLMPVFVENRLRKIRTNQSDLKFAYVPSEENPADLATKCQTLDELVTNNLWWHGPTWLCDQYKVFKEFKPQLDTTVPNLVVPVADVGSKLTTVETLGFEKFSSWNRLIRVVAWIRRFARQARRIEPQHKNVLAAKDVEETETCVLKLMQADAFKDVYTAIEKKSSHQLFRQLNVKKDASGMLRCYGRLTNAGINADAVNPFLIPHKSRLTRLLIQDNHQKNMHTGVSQTLASIRRRFWNPNGRSTVWKVIKDCRHCRRWEGKAYSYPEVPPLPTMRSKADRAFSWVGLDYFGPVYVKGYADEVQVIKCWVCLFTCAAIRAVHLELVSDMTTAEFLLAFRRFIARRGVPSGIICDNAKQFRSARTFMDRFWDRISTDSEILNYMATHKIEWKFIVEAAPNMGGFYERMVGTVKRALKKTIGNLHLTIPQFTTFLVEAEAVVNSRPLLYVGGDFENRSILTPEHFLRGTNSGSTVPDIQGETDPGYGPEPSTYEGLLKLWRRGQEHLCRFWRVWQNEYLLNLREKWNHNARDRAGCQPRISDVVICEERLPRGQWKIGRIVQLCTSEDGKVRAAKIQMSDQKIRQRSLKQVYPLEFAAKDDHTDLVNGTSAYGSKKDFDAIDMGEEKTVKRKAARDALKKISVQMEDSENE